MLQVILMCFIAYIVGSICFADILVKIFKPGINLKEAGTGNPGAENAFSLAGPVIGYASAIFDMAKTIGVMLLAYYLLGWNFNDNLSQMLVLSLFTTLGHDFSIFMKFKGGKGFSVLAGCIFFFGPLYWLTVFSFTSLKLVQKNKRMAYIVSHLIALLIPFMAAFLWFLETRVNLGYYAFKLSDFFLPKIENTMPLIFFSIIWGIIIIIRRLFFCGLIADIKAGVGFFKSVFIRGIFDMYPADSTYVSTDKVMYW